MRHIIYILAIVITVGITQACRTDGGDIGHLYGQWALRSYTVDGDSADVDCDRYSWSFQGTLLLINETLPYNEFIYHFATWQLEGQTLSVDFTHTEVVDSVVKPFNPPTGLGIPAHRVTDMQVEELTSRVLNLSFVDTAGLRHAYRLEKLK